MCLPHFFFSLASGGDKIDLKGGLPHLKKKNTKGNQWHLESLQQKNDIYILWHFNWSAGGIFQPLPPHFKTKIKSPEQNSGSRFADTASILLYLWTFILLTRLLTDLRKYKDYPSIDSKVSIFCLTCQIQKHFLSIFATDMDATALKQFKSHVHESREVIFKVK